MFLWLVPHKYDLAGTVGVFALDVILGGIIGGFALIFQVIAGVIETVKVSLIQETYLLHHMMN